MELSLYCYVSLLSSALTYPGGSDSLVLCFFHGSDYSRLQYEDNGGKQTNFLFSGLLTLRNVIIQVSYIR